MTQEPFDIQLCCHGEPFNRVAVIHTLRHLALRVGWRLHLDSNAEPPRLIYATTENPNEIDARANDVVILSSRAVTDYFASNAALIPITQSPNHRISPFPHPARVEKRDWISADVVAGAFWAMNLLYEQRTRPESREGWITFREDWQARLGLREPAPLADEWLDAIGRAAARVGWRVARQPLPGAPFVVVLTHDVDYLPSPRDYGLPRFVRALARQLFHRRRPADAWRIMRQYARRWRTQPYDNVRAIMREEDARGARSSFQFVISNNSRFDPDYAVSNPADEGRLRACVAATLVAPRGWEVCLHGSYTSARTHGTIAQEKARLESLAGATIFGHRQHYLNFHPRDLFQEVERANLRYDMSIGYNDISGARAATLFPLVPFSSLERPYSFWEIPFVLMDTTLATSYRFSARDAFEHATRVLQTVADAGGCVSVVWHQEQLGGALDPDYDRVYYDLLDWIHANGGAMTTGRVVVEELDHRWKETLAT